MPIRALLVDDVDDVRRLVRTALRVHGGFEVVAEARDGAEAVRLAEEQHPDVVVLDLGLPDLAGREVLSRIRELSPTSKVVVYSGHEADDTWVREHVEGYVLKDEEIDYLVDLLASVGARATRQSVLELPKALTSAALARRFVTATLTDWSLQPLIDPALLVASELAANAVTHADSAFRIQLSLTQRTLRIDVIDFGQGTPEPQPPSTTQEHGRGLLLIDALTTAWGIEEGPGSGKLVWAEITLPDEQA
ncbi:MAG TPA: response regulator [Nocardioides sp.]|nr:response regulator [uncultured Nocardioides sp.]HEX5986687.1 response regulator [Nocardioides sp.]